MWYIRHSALGTTWTKGVKYIKKIGDKYIYPAVKAVGNSAKKLASDVSEDIEDTKRAYERNRRRERMLKNDSRNNARVRENEEETAYTNRNNAKIRENEEEATYTNRNRKRKEKINYVKNRQPKDMPRVLVENTLETDITNRNRYKPENFYSERRNKRTGKDLSYRKTGRNEYARRNGR